MRKDMEWLKDLKVGDEIAVDYSNMWHRNNYRILTVVKITPSGRIELSDGSKYMSDGKKMGESYKYPLRQVTPEIIELVKRRELLYKLKVENLVEKLDSKRLEMLLEWQNEILGGDNT